MAFSLSQLLAAVRQRESSGNYGLTPQQNSGYPNSHASGAYQFQPGTWQQLTRQSGIGTQYNEAYLAPPAVQDQVAAYAASNYNPNSTFLWKASAPTGGYPTVTTNDFAPSPTRQIVEQLLPPNAATDGSAGMPPDPNINSGQVYDLGGNVIGSDYGGGGDLSSGGDPLAKGTPAYDASGNLVGENFGGGGSMGLFDSLLDGSPLTAPGGLLDFGGTAADILSGGSSGGSGQSQWWENLSARITNFGMRAMLMLLAIVFIAIGGYAIVQRNELAGAAGAAVRAASGRT